MSFPNLTPEQQRKVLKARKKAIAERPLRIKKFKAANPDQTSDLDSVPKNYKSIWLDNAEGKYMSSTRRIKLKCLDCVGYEIPVESIGKCDIKNCALWPIRPFQNRDSTDNTP